MDPTHRGICGASSINFANMINGETSFADAMERNRQEVRKRKEKDIREEASAKKWSPASLFAGHGGRAAACFETEMKVRNLRNLESTKVEDRAMFERLQASLRSTIGFYHASGSPDRSEEAQRRLDDLIKSEIERRKQTGEEWEELV